jgi:hypothetical protein
MTLKYLNWARDFLSLGPSIKSVGLQILYFPFLACSQIWLIPLVHDHPVLLYHKFEGKKNPGRYLLLTYLPTYLPSGEPRGLEIS